MIDILKRSGLFSDFTDDELIKISNCLVKREINSGEYLVREGNQARSLFIIESGYVDILKQTANGCGSPVGAVTSGSIIGEVAFLDQYIRSADVVANGEVKVLELSFASLEKLALENSSLGIRLYRMIAASLIEKLKQTTAALTELVASSHLSALGKMATHIAHEINNPFATIHLLTGQIADEANRTKPNTKQILQFTHSIEMALDHISKIMQGVRLVSRDAQNDPLVATHLGRILESTVQLCQGKFNKVDIQINISVTPEDLEIYCRPTQVSQILLNLICNSCDAVENLSERWIRIEGQEIEGYLHISVTDSGVGIPKDIQEKIFNPFFTTKGVEKGTGIGLCISRKIIESHDGSLFLDQNSKNTCFVIKLPKRI